MVKLQQVNKPFNVDVDLSKDVAFVINGWALKIDLKYYRKAFKEFAILSRTAICCRVTPSQKAQLVELLKSYDYRTLAIGDGGNDVPLLWWKRIPVLAAPCLWSVQGAIVSNFVHPSRSQGTTVRVEFGGNVKKVHDATTVVVTTGALYAVSKSFPHTYGQPLAHFLKAAFNVPDAQIISDQPAIRMLISKMRKIRPEYRIRLSYLIRERGSSRHRSSLKDQDRNDRGRHKGSLETRDKDNDKDMEERNVVVERIKNEQDMKKSRNREAKDIYRDNNREREVKDRDKKRSHDRDVKRKSQ
ncbi:phospholipid-transporting ATPase 2-like protein [Tanacetum coccineum]